MNAISRALVALSLASPGAPNFAAPPSACARNEVVVFSCLAGSRVASVCLDASSLLQYRFGAAGKNPELVYPASLEEKNPSFTFLSESRSAKGSIANLQFTHLATTYTIYRFTHAFEGNYAGIAISTSGKPLVRLACKESSVIESFSRPEIERLTPMSSAAIVE